MSHQELTDFIRLISTINMLIGHDTIHPLHLMKPSLSHRVVWINNNIVQFWIEIVTTATIVLFSPMRGHQTEKHSSNKTYALLVIYSTRRENEMPFYKVQFSIWHD